MKNIFIRKTFQLTPKLSFPKIIVIFSFFSLHIFCLFPCKQSWEVENLIAKKHTHLYCQRILHSVCLSVCTWAPIISRLSRIEQTEFFGGPQDARLHMNKQCNYFFRQFVRISISSDLYRQGTYFNSPKPHLLEHFGLFRCNLVP